VVQRRPKNWKTIPEKISKNYRVVYGPEGKRIFARVCPDNVAPV
jgi:hypothetical protein